jgi:hypothetical protein
MWWDSHTLKDQIINIMPINSLSILNLNTTIHNSQTEASHFKNGT